MVFKTSKQQVMQQYKIFEAIILIAVFATGAKTQTSDIVIGVLPDDENNILITWVPATDTIWAAGLQSSYTIIRTDNAGKTVEIGSGLSPQPKTWFEAMDDQDGGFINAIGAILYGEESEETETDNKQNQHHSQYHYLMPEVIRDPFIGEVLGLAFTDSTAEVGQSYTYTVYFDNSQGRRYQGEISVDLQNGFNAYDMEALHGMQFEPPGGRSLMDMRLANVELDQLHVISKAYGDSIVLRWAPNNPTYWNRTLDHAYTVYRWETILEGDSTYSDYILRDSVSPWPTDYFSEERIARDSLILIAAQTLYGERTSTEADGLVAQHSEYVMRYGMAMVAADRSPLAAEALGLRWVDRNVKPGERYSYMILTDAAENIVENGFAMVLNETDTTYQVIDFSSEPGDHLINLTWSKMNDYQFNGYLIYRSDDGGHTFHSLTKAPLLMVTTPQNQESEEHGFTDSIPTNYFPYIYQIRGIDAFGDTGRVTTLEAHGIDLTPPPSPLVYFAEVDETGQILLKWEINDEAGDLNRFHVLLGESMESDYTPIAIDLPKSTRSYVYDEPLSTERSYFFIVVSQDTAGNQNPTLPIYVHLIDTIPPAPPAGLIGMIDSTGLVTITWDHNDEPDLIGYRVYMANNPDHEFSQITEEATEFNLWRDTITLEALDKEVYYKIVAEDRSHNYSEFSEILTLDRPDIIPPAAPASLPASSDAEGIHLFWQPSPSNDVIAYLIYRQNMTEKDSLPQRIARLSDPEAVTWRDTTAVPEVLYEYTIQAQDQSGLLSDLAFPVKGRRRLDLSILDVQTFQAEFRQEYDAAYLRWEYEYPKWAEERLGEVYYYIYRKNGEESWEKIKQVEASLSQYLDRELSDVANITYGIKVVTQNGKSGKLAVSPSVEISK